MKKCDPRAYAACAYKSDCGPLGEAEYADGSECEQFNEKMVSRPLTNADRIRAMSDEELAKFLFDALSYKTMCAFCVPVKFSSLKCDGRCRNGILKWLQQPAKEGGGDNGSQVQGGYVWDAGGNQAT